MAKGTRGVQFSALELLIYRAASIAFHLVMLVKLFKAELASL